MFGVGILLGSSLAYFSLRLIGWKSAVFIAAASGLATIFIWGHPYALIVFALELVVVSILFKRFEWSIVTAAMFYWILLGAPLAYVLYTQLLGMPGAALLIALKQSVNGIFLAVLADVAFVLFSILISKRKRAPLVTLTDVIRSLLIILFSAPLLFLLTTTSKGLRESAEFRLGWAVEQNVRYFSSRVDAWVSGSILASAAQAADLAQQWNQTCEAPIQKSPTTSQLRFVQAVSNVPFEKPRRPLPSYFAAESILIEVIEGQQQYGVRIAVNAALPNCDEPGYLIFESFYQPSYLDLSEFKPYPLQGLSLIETGGSTLFQMGIVPAAEHMEPASFEMTHDGGRLLSTYLPASGQPMTSWQQASVIAQIPSTVVANWLYTAVVGYSQIISEIQAEQSRLLALFLVLALFVGYLGQGFSKILLASHTQFVTNPSHRSPEERLELARATPLGWVQEIDEVISQLASYERTAMNSMRRRLPGMP